MTTTESAPPVTAPFLDRATEIGTFLVDTAITHDGRSIWSGDDTGSTIGSVVHRTCGTELYSGTSGIALFLAALARSTGDAAFADAARRALRQALARPPSSAGLYTGRVGVAVAAAQIGQLLDDGACAFSRSFVDDAIATFDDEGFDLIAGDAGSVIGLLALGHDDAALAVGRRLAARREPSADGRCWPSGADEPALCGLAHGASGPVAAFASLLAVSDETWITECLVDALGYERAWFDSEIANWPDLRDLGRSALRSGATWAAPSFWCHGAVGIGIARLLAHRHLPDGDRLLAEAGAAVDTATRQQIAAMRNHAPGDHAANLSVCHGLSGTVELHLIAAALTGEDEHLAVARHLAAPMLEYPVDQLPCGVYLGGQNPGLMLGLAGIGATLLRCHRPDALVSPALPITLLPV